MRENIFRCQYQKGKVCISEVIQHEKPISAPEILVALCKLAVKVKEVFNEKRGGKVALQVLTIHEHFIKGIKDLKIGTGASRSYYLDRKSKKKNNRSERIDLEFIGEYGQNDSSNIISSYINSYRELKNWDMQTPS